MLSYQIYQCKLKDSMAFGKWYARVVTDETLGVEGLAQHMHAHNTPFSSGMIKGILMDAIACTKELLLEGKRVQWDNLASFGVSIEHKMGAETADDFSVAANVKGIKLIAQGIGMFSSSILTSGARLGENKTYVSPKTPNTGKAYVSFNIDGEGFILVNGDTITTNETRSYPMGTVLEIEASPKAENSFTSWEDGTSEAARSVTLNSSSTSITATFSPNMPDGPDII